MKNWKREEIQARNKAKLEQKIEDYNRRIAKKKKLFNSYAESNYKQGKTLFITLTYPYIQNDVKKVTEDIRALFRCLSITSWIYCIEKQRNSSYHVHAVAFDNEYIPYEELKTKWNGLCWIKRVNDIYGLLNYLSPYLQPAKGTYSFYRSRNLLTQIEKDALNIFGSFVRVG